MIEPNLDRVWAALMTAARPSRTPFTVLQLATSGLDGAPKVRSVILRGADAERGAVSFFTDLHSAKIEEMRHEPRVSLVGYDADAGFQIRLEGKATIDAEGPENQRRGLLVDLIPAHSSGIRCLPGPRSTHQPKLRPPTTPMAKGISP